MNVQDLTVNDLLHFKRLLQDKDLARATPKQSRKVLKRKKYPEHLIELYVAAKLKALADAKKAQA